MTPEAGVSGSELKVVCAFVGYPRSGHSLVGALLDAHPDVVIAHQVDLLRLASEGLGRDELVATLVGDSSRRAEEGRRQGRYSYAVEGQWQGRVRDLLVIGDANAGKSSKRLARDPSAAGQATRVLGAPLRLVHVVRNPYDNIATLSQRPEHTTARAIETYDTLAGIAARLIERGGPPVLTLRHESLVEAPQRELARLCAYLGVEPDADYLDACAAVVFPSPRRTRDEVSWTGDEPASVQAMIGRYPFLQGYSFET